MGVAAVSAQRGEHRKEESRGGVLGGGGLQKLCLWISKARDWVSVLFCPAFCCSYLKFSFIHLSFSCVYNNRIYHACLKSVTWERTWSREIGAGTTRTVTNSTPSFISCWRLAIRLYHFLVDSTTAVIEDKPLWALVCDYLGS